MGNREVLDKVEKGYKHPKPQDCPAELYQTMLQCWKDDYFERPTFEYLHGFLDDFHIATERTHHDISYL